MTAAASELLTASALAARLRAGRPVIFPTDTLPALAALPQHADQIWALKERPRDKPLILMAADLQQVVAATGLPWREEWLQVAQRCWPGAFTLVLPASGGVAAALNPGGCTLGLRIPASPEARAVLRESGPLATTSANRSGEPPCADAEEAVCRFPSVDRLGPLPWPAGSGQASTVLAWTAGGGWQTLRAGVSAPFPLEPTPCSG